MPELPEVETVRDGLVRHVLGRRVDAVTVHHPRAVRRHVGGGLDLPGRLTGRTLSAAVRRGKYLWLLLDDDASDALLVHLGMSGQLLVRRDTSSLTLPAPESLVHPPSPPTPTPTTPPAESGLVAAAAAPAPATPPAESGLVAGAPAPTAAPGVPPDPARHLRVELELDDGTGLWFVDQRTFGHLLVADLVPTADDGPGGHGSPLPALPGPAAHIARDPLDPALDVAALARRLRGRRTEAKRALLDQSLVSGIGNIYADEALWRARLHPRRATDRLTQATAVELLAAAEAVMREALAAGGTSFDALYVDVDGASGYFARSLDAYGRAGQPCRRCGALMRREAFMGRASTFCPRCQRAPR
ncbi:bifunctional DNA-formamidopyrimidine glycosylase/DNA-(apurinic or apyrimidinic site) lyase [Georgenia sp. H159]|uniref:bifunctional DNA-formamidopyrimidine glycosylase/DNA-(apurinic or apyrimidinic site) lyase n=1 Tax=Georgenia sp. H159 TaxID=3076115 RepID=UPI002D771408|nr:bifunctional DNA-formamidopyrimidine glycosylase/DNA-(apurinic or apyrimidinic site) lyase [Georgenia sp. H159]